MEKLQLRSFESTVRGSLKPNPEVFRIFRDAPYDILPQFRAPLGRENKPARGRGKDHPRYGRFTYSMARACRPEIIVEVGTYAGGTSIGWCRALAENGSGRLICVDNDSYCKGTYPEIAEENLLATGLARNRFELMNGDSREIIPALAKELEGQIDLYLVDADHTYEGATIDITNGLPMLKPGGLVLVHDLDRARKMAERTPQHPHPVHEAFMEIVDKRGYSWCVLPFIRKHLGIFQIP